MSLKAIIFLINLLSPAIRASKLDLYFKDGKAPVKLTGDECPSGALFSGSSEFSCACISGLWAFYRQNCDKAEVFVAGTSGQCFPVDFPIQKVNLLSPLGADPTASSAVVFDAEIRSIGSKFTSDGRSQPATHFVPPGFPVVVTTGNQSWRLPGKKACLKPTDSNVTQFCMFDHDTNEEYKMDEGCLFTDTNVTPLICIPFMEDKDVGLTDPKSCEKQGTRVRRDTHKLGRVFLGAVMGLRGNSTNDTDPQANLTALDENHGLNVTITQPILNSELWNFMTLRAQVLLGLRQPRRFPLESPAFKFLEIAKRILQTACPDHYVRDEHFDISVGAFINIQKNHLKYMDDFVDFATTERIEEALQACFQNATEYPFPERTGAASGCNGTDVITHGMLKMFNATIDFGVGIEASGRTTEPIIETVWKVFLHAHAACFPFFKRSFNDHHRFTTIMLPLFTNDVNDIWKNTTGGTLQPDIYSGFLGNAVELMDSVDYCSMFSRLESKYPWDLPRPNKHNARRKREAAIDYSYQCLNAPDAQNFCSPPDGGWDEDDDSYILY